MAKGKSAISRQSKRRKDMEREGDLSYAAGAGVVAVPVAVIAGVLFGPPGAVAVLGAEAVGAVIARRGLKRAYPKTPKELEEEDRQRRNQTWL